MDYSKEDSHLMTLGLKETTSYDLKKPMSNTIVSKLNGIVSNFPGDDFGPACAIGRYIYLVGSGNPAVGPSTKTMRYDIDNDRWDRVADMNTARTWSGLVAHKGKIFAFGGRTEESMIWGDTTCEIYDPDTDSWTPGPPLTEGQYYLNNNSIVSVNNDILSFAAMRGPSADNSHDPDPRIFRMNGRENRWEVYDTLPFRRYRTFSVNLVGDRLYLMDKVGLSNISYDVSNLFSEQEPASSFLLHPNPAIAESLIRLNTELEGESWIVIYNSTGQQVRQLSAGRLPAGEHEIPLDLSGLESGIYYIVMRPGQVESQVLIKE